MTHELNRLDHMVVANAHFVDGHSVQAVRHDLARVLNWSSTFNLAHW